MLRKAIAVLVLLLGVYVIAIEPYRMKWTEQELKLSRIKRQIRILFVSDLQLKGQVGMREKWIVSHLPDQKVDLVLTTGDLFDTPDGMQSAIEFLGQLSTQAPTFAILGNWEHWSLADLNNYKANLRQKGVVLLVNESHTFTSQDQKIYVVGVDDPSQGRHNLPLALKEVPEDSLKILLAHAPIIFPEASANKIDLMLAGHTHGGQVRIPFLDPLFLPPGCGPYVYGTYKNNESTLLVTSGVGTSILPIRFWCRPEIVLLKLKPSATR